MLLRSRFLDQHLTNRQPVSLQVMRLYDYDASGNCFKVRLLLALLGRQYERVPVDIFAGDTLTAEYGRLNPFRETPVLDSTTEAC